MLFLGVALFSADVGRAKQGQQPQAKYINPSHRTKDPAGRKNAAPSHTPSEGFAVAFHRPEGKAPYHTQIQIGFTHPLVPLTSVTDRQRSEVLSKFSITPPAPGHFRLIGDSAVVFSSPKLFSASTRYTVSVGANLKDIHGHTLGKELRWSLETPRVSIHAYTLDQPTEPRPTPAENVRLALQPGLILISNAPLRLSSLQQKTRLFKVDGKGRLHNTGITFNVAPMRGNPPVVQDIGTDYRDYRYKLTLPHPLERHSHYRLRIEPGVVPEVGNLPSSQAEEVQIATFMPLTFRVANLDCGDLFKRGKVIEPNNPLVISTVKNAVTIEPPLLSGARRLSALEIPEKELLPNTLYRITISPKVSDIYGQHPARPVRLSLRTDNYRPAIKVLSDYNIITPITDPSVPYRVRNPGILSVRAYGMSEEELLRAVFSLSEESANDFLVHHKKRSPARTESFPTNANVVRWFDLSPCLGRDGFGIAFYQMATSNLDSCYYGSGKGLPVVRAGALLRTNIGLHVHLLPGGMAVWATHLTDGSPVADATVRVYRCSTADQPELLIEARTDENGRLLLSSARLTPQGKFLDEPDGIVVIVRQGADYAFATPSSFLQNDLSLYSFNVFADWEGSKVYSLGGIFSDRQLYLDGETVTLKGVVRYREEDRIATPSGLSMKVKLEDPNGDSTVIGNVTTDEFGSFALEIPTQEGAPLGRYHVRAEAEKLPFEITGSFRLADVRPPRYRARVATDKDLYIVGDIASVTAVGEYLFGAPLAGGQVTFVVNAKATDFAPPNWHDFSFAIPDWIAAQMEDRESPDKNLLKKTETLDSKGECHLSFPVIAEDVPRPMSLSFEVDVRDISGQSVGASRSVIALPHPRLTGVKVEESLTQAGKPVKARIIVTDPQGQPLPDVPLRVELQSVQWRYKTSTEGEETFDENVPEFRTVAVEKVTSERTPVAVSFIPKQTGEYVIRAYFSDHPSTGTEGADWLFAYGSGLVGVEREAQREDMKLELKTDREVYEVGEEVSVVVPSPFKTARMMATVEREKVFWQELTTVEQGATVLRFLVTPEMVPNVFIEVALIETGTAGSNLFGEYAHRPYRIGLTQVNISRESHRLQVKVNPRQGAYRPRDTAQIDFRVTDHSGKPASVQLTVMVVDEAILQLTGYRLPDLVETMLPERALSLVLLDNRPFVIHAGKRIPLHKGYGYGNGGKSESLAVQAEVRRDFKRLAYFNPDLRTNADGEATCQFPLPDTLTTWRVMTVAVSRGMEFGYGDSTFLVNQPLIMENISPRFARVDDTIFPGVAINNQTGADGVAHISVTTVEGASHLLAAEVKGDRVVRVHAGQTVPVRWRYKVVGAGRCVLRFGCRLEGKVAVSDALEVQLNTQPPAPVESTAIADEVHDRRGIDIQVTNDMRTDIGELNLLLSSTAFGNLTPETNFLLNYEYQCAEQLASRLLGLLAMEEPCRQFGLQVDSPTPLKAILSAGLRQLWQFQSHDGSFSYWRNGFSDLSLNAYIAEVIRSARARHHDVPDRVVARLADYLKKLYPVVGTDAERMHSHVLRAYGLYLLGQPEQTYYAEMFSKKGLLPLIDKMRLAIVFLGERGWKKQAEELHTEIMKQRWITSRTAHAEEHRSDVSEWRFFDSPLATVALGLKLDLLMNPQDPTTSKVVTYLLNSRRRGGIRNTYETARLLDAVCNYVETRESREPRFTAEITLDGGTRAEFNFAGYELGQRLHTFALRDLGTGRHKVEFRKRGQGTLYIVTELKYYPTAQQPPLSEGFFITREMANVRTGKQVTNGGEVEVGDIVKVKLTMTTPQNGYHIIVESPIPAGMAAVDTSLQTTPEWQRREEFERDNSRAWHYWSNPFDHIEQRKDRVALFATEFAAGVYEYQYLLQAITPGTFVCPPARIYRMYEPEEFGSTGWDTIVIQS